MRIKIKLTFRDLFYLAVIVVAFIVGKSFKKPTIPGIPNQPIVIEDTTVTAKPADTTKPKIIERIVYLPSTPVSISRNVGGVDQFLLENPRGITEVVKKGNVLSVKGYFRDTAVAYTYPLRHENFRVRLTYDRFIVDQPRLKVDKFVGLRVLYPDYSLGVYGGLLFNDRFGFNVEINTKGVGIGLVYFIR